MKESNIIAFILALVVGLWMGIGIMNVGAGVGMFIAVFLVAKLFLWGLNVDMPQKIALRTTAPLGPVEIRITAKDMASPEIERCKDRTAGLAIPVLTIPPDASREELEHLEDLYIHARVTRYTSEGESHNLMEALR